MKVSELISLLQACALAGDVQVTLDAALVDGDNVSDGFAYNFEDLDVQCLHSTNNFDKPDIVYIGISEGASERCFESRRMLAEEQSVRIDNRTPKDHESEMTANAPVAVAVAISLATYDSLLVVVDNCNYCDSHRGGMTTHGKLSVSSLLAMLAEDAAMMNTRPGSWEGANMQHVFDSHGYQ